MILTITLNPAVDISYRLNHLSIDSVNRVNGVTKTAGGKGLNVARVLHQLEEDVAASGFLGGSLGNFISSQIAELGIQDYFVPIKGETRNCIAVIHDGKQTEILESGPNIDLDEAALFLEKFTVYVQQVDIVTISGSLPKGIANDFYEKLLTIAAEHKTPVLLDTKGELLAITLKSKTKPFLIKPNQDELADLVGKNLAEEADIIDALNTSIFADVPWVVVTLGAKGAIVKNEGIIYRVMAPKVDATNPVGSGDSVIAGFAAGLSRGLKGEDLVKFGLTMGVLNAMEESTGQIDPEKVEWCVGEMEVEKIAGD
ncbi:1-phosphofructokinase family hexose kinase [Virgibacillus byunsanensis]|uniref:Tagatose-6-phosphate kinase n=1 Tax=Virgibacillus byunsanensis TaxID=570945 RepID=A0ABW3LGT1_9BACI